MVRAWLLALLLTLVQGLVWWLITPSWTAPDEPGHYLYARLIADHGRIPTRADSNASTEAPVIASLAASNWWDYEGRPVPQPLPEQLAGDAVLAASGLQFQNEPALFYTPPALMLRWLDVRGITDPVQALRWLRLWSLSIRLIVVIASLFLARSTWPDKPDRALGLGVLVGMIPMVGFIGGSFNNAVLALAWGAVAFTLLATASTRWRWLLAMTVVVAGPLLVDKGLLFLWPTALFWALFKIQRLRRYRLLILTGLIILLVLLLVPNPRWAAGWGPYPVLSGNRSSDDNLHLYDHQTSLAQVVSGKSILALRDQMVVLQADVWGEPGSVLNLQVSDGRQIQQQSCEVSPQQQRCELPFVLGSHVYGIGVQAALADDGYPQATDDIYLRLSLVDDSGRDLLYNGDGRYAASIGSPLFAWLEQQLPIPAGFFARALSPTAWDAPAQFRYLLFAGFTWASFWGYFGWLSRPLPWWSYALLAGFMLLAAWGLLQWTVVAIKRWRRQQTSRTDQLLVLSLAAFLFILAQVWTPMLGQAWQPQGRYLFSALLPISVILFLGWEKALPVRWRPYLTPSLIFGLVVFNLLAWMIVR